MWIFFFLSLRIFFIVKFFFQFFVFKFFDMLVEFHVFCFEFVCLWEYPFDYQILFDLLKILLQIKRVRQRAVHPLDKLPHTFQFHNPIVPPREIGPQGSLKFAPSIHFTVVENFAAGIRGQSKTFKSDASLNPEPIPITSGIPAVHMPIFAAIAIVDEPFTADGESKNDFSQRPFLIEAVWIGLQIGHLKIPQTETDPFRFVGIRIFKKVPAKVIKNPDIDIILGPSARKLRLPGKPISSHDEMTAKHAAVRYIEVILWGQICIRGEPQGRECEHHQDEKQGLWFHTNKKLRRSTDSGGIKFIVAATGKTLMNRCFIQNYHRYPTPPVIWYLVPKALSIKISQCLRITVRIPKFGAHVSVFTWTSKSMVSPLGSGTLLWSARSWRCIGRQHRFAKGRRCSRSWGRR